MKYNEILSLNEYFQPVYVITEEREDYWKQFIPNEKFYNVMSTSINAIESSSSLEKKKSLWLGGTYGTGKTHATAVVKHLLWDDLDDISDFVERIDRGQLRERLTSFREQHKVFPVILKGVSNITDIRTFSLVIEKAVKDALRHQKIENISTKSDFEKMIYQVDENPYHIDWNKIIDESPELGMFVNNKEDILEKLKNNDVKILRILETISSSKHTFFAISNISEWLIEVVEELKRKNIADYLMIYWDEFTSVLEQEKASSFLNELQNLAELKEKGIYVMVITHKISDFPHLKNEEVGKVLDRFHYLDYSMEPITTYHIVETAIKKVNTEQWTEMKRDKLEENDKILNLIHKLIGEEYNVEKIVKNLFPIHPYTAYLATFIARNIGSTERSIFNFLYDKENGFLKFIEDNPGDGGDFYLTADYLWDYFIEDFERDNYEKFGSILNKYKLNISNLQLKGTNYASIFKGILLLNTLHHVVRVRESGSGLVTPSIDNIRSMFLGTQQENYVDEVLEYIESREIIQKAHDNLFLVATSALPAKEVDQEKEKLKDEYKDITTILTSDQMKEVKNILTSSVLRKTEVKLFWAGEKEHILTNKLSKAFRKSYSLNIAVFIGKTDQEIFQIKTVLKPLSKEDDFKNVIFVVLEDSFTDDVFNKFIDYKARVGVSARHNFKEDKVTHESYAMGVIGGWINKTKSGYLGWYFEGNEGKELASRFGELLNNDISGRVFISGLETLNEVRNNRNIWNFKQSPKSIEIFLFADSRRSIEERTSSGVEKDLRAIIKDNRGEYVISENLEIKSDADENHPVVKMLDDVKRHIGNNKEKGVFHLGEVLKFLSKSPYGLYTNMANMATLGFLMNPFVGRLYESRTGKPLDRGIMRDKILSLFRYWQQNLDSNKLEVRFGTEEEKELIDILKDIFKLEDVDSLNDVRWKIREWVKEVKYPLWTFKVSCDNDKIKEGIGRIGRLIKSIDPEIDQKCINESLHSIKAVNYDLSLLINRGEAKELFTTWLKDIENVSISDDEIETVVDFLGQHMQEEVVSWDEVRVEKEVMRWRLMKDQQLRKSKESEDEVEIEKTEEKPIHAPSLNGNDERVEKTKQKIQNYSGSTKELLIKLIDEHPELCELLEEYLE